MNPMVGFLAAGFFSVCLIGCAEPAPRPTATSPAPGFQRVATGPAADTIQDPVVNDVEDDTAETGDVNNPNAEITDTEGTGLPEILVDETVEIPETTAQEIEYDEAEAILEDANDIDEIEELEDLENIIIPNEVNLDIPFYAQAPDGNWELPRKEACEEASIILARYYLADERLTKATFKKEVLAMVELENQILGKFIDTSMEETQRVYEEFYGDFGETKIIENPTIEQLKIELAQGHPIIAPFAGKELGNSNFTNGGPRYHVLVIRGYDETYFYTNDVGTKRGENFPYTHDVIMDALHDLIPVGEGNITDGDKRVLVLMND